jgi:uncharacterized protein (DUF983 family)
MTQKNQQIISTGSFLSRGFRRRWPSCGTGHLFHAYPKRIEKCETRAAECGNIRADDISAYFTILLVGHVVMPLACRGKALPSVSVGTPVVLDSPPLTLVQTLGPLPHTKGAAVSIMWRLRINGSEMQ